MIASFGTVVDGQNRPGSDQASGISPVSRVQHYAKVNRVDGVTLEATATLTAIMADGTSRAGVLAVTVDTLGLLTEPYSPQGWGSGYAAVYQIRVMLAITARNAAGAAGPAKREFAVTVLDQTPGPGTGSPPPTPPTPPPASTITGSAIQINGVRQEQRTIYSGKVWMYAALDTDGLIFELNTAGPATPTLTLDILATDGSTFSLELGVSSNGPGVYYSGLYSARQIASVRGISFDVVQLRAHWKLGASWSLTETVNITPAPDAQPAGPPPPQAQQAPTPSISPGLYLDGAQYDGMSSAQVRPDETIQCYVVVKNPAPGLTYRAEAQRGFVYADGIPDSGQAFDTQAATMTSWMTPAHSLGEFSSADGGVYRMIVRINVYANGNGMAESQAATQVFTLTNPSA